MDIQTRLTELRQTAQAIAARMDERARLQQEDMSELVRLEGAIRELKRLADQDNQREEVTPSA